MPRGEHSGDFTLLVGLSAQTMRTWVVQGLPERGANSASSPPDSLALWPSILMAQGSWKQVMTCLALQALHSLVISSKAARLLGTAGK